MFSGKSYYGGPVNLTGTAPRPAGRRSLPVALRVGAAVAIAVLMVACGAAQAQQAKIADSRPVTSVAEHWGSFFGGRKGNFGTQKSPVSVTLPGIIAQVGSSNSTQYALLTNGRLYAWGLGTQGQLGVADDRRERVVQVVGDPAGEPADRFELL